MPRGRATRDLFGNPTFAEKLPRCSTQESEKKLNRRQFIQSAAAIPVAASIAGSAAKAAPAGQPFNASQVRDLARNLAGKPFVAPDDKLPDALAQLDYDAYRSIRLLSDHALWRSEKLPFQAQFFHRGFMYKDRVDV